MTASRAMAEQVAELREQVRQLKHALRGDLRWPPAWRLTRKETRMLGVLVVRDTASRTALLLATDAASEKSIDVSMSHLRPKLRRHVPGVTINTSVGLGYWLSRADRDRLRNLAVEGK